MKSVILFLVVRMLSVSNKWTIAVGPLPSLQRDNILSLAYSLKTIFSIFVFRALIYTISFYTTCTSVVSASRKIM